MQYPFKAHPTRYKDVLFRSRLEARWAAFFDIIGWKWDYELVDLDGWTPDFLIYPGKSRGPQPYGHFNKYIGAEKIFVEIKPVDKPDLQAWDDKEGFPLSKIAKAIPNGSCVCLGLRPDTAFRVSFQNGKPYDSCGLILNSLRTEWAEAGNLTMYRKPNELR